MHIAFRPSLYAENNSSALNSTENISRWVQLDDDPIAVASAFLDVPNASLVKSVGHAGIETWFKAFWARFRNTMILVSKRGLRG